MAIDLMTYEMAAEAAGFIKAKYAGPIKTAIVLGSGLGAFADELMTVAIPYEEILTLRSTVEGHAGRLVLGEIGGVAVAVGAAFIFTKATRWSRSRFRCVSSG